MRTRAELAVATMTTSRDVLMANIKDLSLEEALQAAGGYRSILGILKHTAGWSRVYWSYAFEESPRHWAKTDWPRGLIDTIDTTQEYLNEIVAWLDASYRGWASSLSAQPDEEFERPHRCHWGETMPLWDIVSIISHHWRYHTGEINALLSIIRGQAWEYTEEVEENHISTAGHRLRPGWMSDAHAAAHEAYLAKRDGELHGT
jgi:uncharacterized damage-inducible protein DinB